MQQIRVLDGSRASFEGYGTVPSAFEVRSRLRLDALRPPGFSLEEIPVTPKWKDYDALEAPESLPERFDTSPWAVLAADLAGDRAGGAVVAWATPAFRMLRGRRDLAVLVDLRVHPAHQRSGLGSALFRAAATWARDRGCVEMHVETQDVNVAACRFYAAMGCEPIVVRAGAYRPEIPDEAMIVWRIGL